MFTTEFFLCQLNIRNDIIWAVFEIRPPEFSMIKYDICGSTTRLVLKIFLYQNRMCTWD